MNTETDAVEEEAFKPPPKMADIMPGAALPPAIQAPVAVDSTPALVSAPSNANYGTLQQGNNNDSINQLPAHMSGAHQPAPKLGEPTKVPNLQSNMFKMQRNRSKF